MAVMVWPTTRRVVHCAQCGRRIPRASYVERVNGQVVALCLTHRPRPSGGAA
jgi:hypothetical protein